VRYAGQAKLNKSGRRSGLKKSDGMGGSHQSIQGTMCSKGGRLLRAKAKAGTRVGNQGLCQRLGAS
jgi:hypothetical protein